MTDDEDIRGYQSGLPGVLGVLDLWISRFEGVILAAGVLLMALNVVSNVISRFFFGQSLFFAEEISRILIVMITFAGIGYAARHGRHIRMSAIYDQLPVLGRKVMMVMISVVTGLLMFILCYYSVRYIHGVYSTGRVLPALGLPVWLMYVWVPIGFTITGIQYLLTAVRNLTSPDVYLSSHVLDGYADTESEV